MDRQSPKQIVSQVMEVLVLDFYSVPVGLARMLELRIHEQPKRERSNGLRE